MTWVSPDGNTVNQIDCICIGTKFRRSLLDIHSKRRADTALDHHLVVGKLQLTREKIPAEALKAELANLVDMLFPQMWGKDEISQDWKERYIVKLPK